MNETSNSDADPRLREVRRRTVSRGAAWSVPLVVLAAAAPAIAASVGVAGCSVDTRCRGTRSNGGIAAIHVDPLPAAAQIAITVSHSGSGGYTADPDFTPTSTTVNPDGSTTYVVTGGGAAFVGQIGLTFALGQNATGVVVVTVSAVSGVTLTGDPSGSLTVHRDGNSSNYACSAS